MQLLYTAASPFARKARVMLREKGLSLIETEVNPHDDPPALLAANPMAQVPALVLEDGRSLFDSPVICEYIDGLVDQPRLIPADPARRIAALRSQALADGLMTAGVAIVVELRRPSDERSPQWLARWQRAIDRSLAVMEGECPMPGEPFDLAQISLACALGYLDLRFPAQDWRSAHPRLGAWFAEVARRPSMADTRAAG